MFTTTNLHSASPKGPRATSAPAPIGRRTFVLLVASCCAPLSWRPAFAQDSAARKVSLDEFMRISRVLTGFDDLSDDTTGRQYLDALQSSADGGRLLEQLWELGGFEGAESPASTDDLAVRGLYDVPGLAELADAVTASWYSGTHVAPSGERRVATYTDALAWRALGYKPSGPSACGGAFGHWADRPVA
jgi:hypothetical protein